MPEQPANAGQPRDKLQHLPAGAEGRMSHNTTMQAGHELFLRVALA